MFEKFFENQIQQPVEQKEIPLSKSQYMAQTYFPFDSEKLIKHIAEALNNPDKFHMPPAHCESSTVFDNKTIKFIVKLEPSILQMIGMSYPTMGVFSLTEEEYSFRLYPVKEIQLPDEDDSNSRDNFSFANPASRRGQYPVLNLGFTQPLWCFEVMKLETPQVSKSV